MFHGPALPGVPETAIRRTHPFGYDGDAPVYRCRLSTTHGMD
jgi:hypothetical protein